jgi:glycosyltransferase involved in cell wall biosynthesis
LLRKSNVFQTVLPTKMLEFMSCARPVILAVEGQAQHILEEAHGGLAIEPENTDALAGVVRRLAFDAEMARKLGENGRAYILRKFSRASTAQKYLRVLQGVVSLKAEAEP